MGAQAQQRHKIGNSLSTHAEEQWTEREVEGAVHNGIATLVRVPLGRVS